MSHTNPHHSLTFFSRSRLSLSICGLLLAFLLTACSLGSGSTGPVSSTTSANTPATSQGTAVPAQPTSAPAAGLTTYTGNGFTIGYPAGWTVMQEGHGQVMIVNKQADAAQGSVFMIGLNPAGGGIPPAVLLQFELNQFTSQPHYQKVAIAPKATVGGDSWDQFAATDDVQIPGQAQPETIETVVMADDHPAVSPTARGFVMRYSADASRFAHINATIFQAMLQSFTFV
ncbi:MAG: hypothetical protein ACRDIV_09185 [Ktedonobacteraceae bacterium]